jgi:carboxyl-terminal processing protease
MLPRVLRARAALGLALAVLWIAPQLAHAGSPSVEIPSAALAPVAVDEVLRQGRSLEKGEKWAEALSHYEDALRQFPGDRTLLERHDTARIHFDLARRYQDNSFRRSLRTLARRDATAVLSEVFLKIETHYVHAPNWRDLVAHGTLMLETALAKEAFRRHNLPQIAEERIAAFGPELRRYMAARPVRDRHQALEAISGAADFANAQLGLSPVVSYLEYTAGVVSALDSYSTYLTPDQLRDVFSQIDGNFVGLGVEIKAAGDGLSIVSVIADSPAARAGLAAGDLITAVDGRSTRDASTDQAASWLQGAEGSIAALTVVSANQSAKSVHVRRAHVEVPSIENTRMLDAATGVGYLKLVSFQKTTTRDLDAALWQLHRDGMKILVIDLRGNPGGLLSTSVEVADKFIASGTIVSTRGRSAQEDFNYTAHKVGTWHVPLVVLVDGDSASASEIFAGAIQDNRRGTIVGRRSFGKGSVQGIFPLDRGGTDGLGGVRLTTAKFYSPSGRPISGGGITPDVTVHRTAKLVSGAAQTGAVQSDEDIAAALNAARRLVVQR